MIRYRIPIRLSFHALNGHFDPPQIVQNCQIDPFPDTLKNGHLGEFQGDQFDRLVCGSKYRPPTSCQLYHCLPRIYENPCKR